MNLPGIALPHTPGTHRLVHLHRNVPGVLATINQLLAEHGANIEGQLLGTRDELGYVLTDIGTEYPDDMLARLGLAGCIIGRALYEGRLQLAEVLALVRKEVPAGH